MPKQSQELNSDSSRIQDPGPYNQKSGALITWTLLYGKGTEVSEYIRQIGCSDLDKVEYHSFS